MTPHGKKALQEPLRPISRREIVWILGLLLVAAVTRAPGIFSRAVWYDEMIGMVEMSGHVAPAWPRQPAPAGEARTFFSSTATPAEVYRVLRDSDGHPPLYFWSLCLWRHVFGPSIEAARGLSFAFSLASVLVGYVLLRSARVEQAHLATLVFVLSTGAAHAGHEARPYALAELALLSAALAAYLASTSEPRRALAWALGMAAALGVACHTLYLSGLTAVAVLAWFALRLWRRSRTVAVTGVVATAVLVALTVPLLLVQREQPRPLLQGSLGLVTEVVTFVGMNAKNLGLSVAGSVPSAAGDWGAILGGVEKLAFLALMAVGGLHAWRRHRAGEPVWSLLAVLAVAPTLGVFTVNVALDQGFHLPRYVVFAAAGLAVLAAAGLLGLRGRLRLCGVFLLGALLLIQASRINWGFERCARDQSGGIKRSMASLVDGYESPGRLVLISAGSGRGSPAVWLYELRPETQVAVFDDETDVEALLRDAWPYPDLWVAFSADKETRFAERRILRRLRTSGAYVEVFGNPFLSHFVRLPAPED